MNKEELARLLYEEKLELKDIRQRVQELTSLAEQLVANITDLGDCIDAVSTRIEEYADEIEEGE